VGFRWIYIVLAILVTLGGIGGSVWWLYSNITKLPGELKRVVIPGKSTFTLDERGEYTIFYEYKSFIDGKVYATGENLGEFEIKILNPGGGEVEVKSATVSSEYNVGAYSGYGVYTFDAPTTGEYTITGSIGDGSGASGASASSAQPQKAVLAIGNNLMGKIFGIVFGMIGLVFGSLIAGGILMAIAIVGMIRQRAQQI